MRGVNDKRVNARYKILCLFIFADRVLTTNEIIIGMYKKYGVEMKRVRVGQILREMRTDGVIDNEGRGSYKLMKPSTTNP